MNTISKIFRGDRVIWVLFMFFCIISLIEVYSASSTLTFKSDYWKPISRHTIFLLGGALIVLFVHSVKPKFFSIAILFLPISWLLLVLVRAFGETINDSQRWFEVFGVTFQPSEIAKICLIITVAFILSKRKKENNDKIFKIVLVSSAVTCLLIFFENFSTAALLFAVIFFMMFIGQIPKKRLGMLVLVIVALILLLVLFVEFAPTSWHKTVPRLGTWQSRLETFFEPKEELSVETFKLTDENRQRTHAQIAIAEGKVFGVMPGNSYQRDFLPQAYSDFIYAIIIEEMGIIGAITILFLYIVLFVRAGQIAGRCDKLFPKYLVMGCALMIIMQALINMAVAVGLFPITGQPLPLVSRGGTSMLVTCVYIGIILSVSRFENPKGVKKEEEIQQELIEQQEAEQNLFPDEKA